MFGTQRGFTLIELVIAMVLSSIIVSVMGSALYHFLSTPAREADHITAVHELRFALDMIQNDGVQAQSFTISEAPDYGYFTGEIYDPDLGDLIEYTVSYSYDNVGGKLIREETQDSTIKSIASYIACAEDVVFVLNEEGNSVMLTITVTVDNGRGSSVVETGTRNIEMRVAP
jgi:prepilin-type N-terminal cleavage/methylation domain-containing protein